MKKGISLILTVLIIITIFLVSCAPKKQNSGLNASSDISYTDSSEIAKTEEGGEFTFAFDPYVLSEDAKKAMGTTAYYKKFVNAVISSEKTVSIPTREDYDNIRFAIGESFPYSALIKIYRYDSQNNQVQIYYNYDTEFDSKIKNFEMRVKDVFDGCVNNTDDKAIAAISLYSWLVQNVEITSDNKIVQNDNEDSSGIAVSDISVDDKNNEFNTDIYNTLMEKKGTPASVSALYNFLVMQLGIEGKTVSAWKQSEYKTWNMIKLGMKWYHCDIASEQKENDGQGLMFFGMTEKKAFENAGVNEAFTGQSKWFTNKLPNANSKRFECFENIVSWELSPSRNSITAYTEEFSRFNWNIED